MFEEDDSVNRILENGRLLIDILLKDTKEGWSVSSPDVLGNRKIRRPTTCKIPHLATHSALIKLIKPSPRLEDFARMIGSPTDFSTILHALLAESNSGIRGYLNKLNRLPDDATKSDVQSALIDLIEQISAELGITVITRLSQKMAVGGILAYSQYDIRGEADICIYNTDNICLLVIEVKTRKAFHDERWYHDSRATQTLTPLYHFNAPTFLATTDQYKLFFENSKRDSIYTHPSFHEAISEFHKTIKIGIVGEDFLLALIICLRSFPASKGLDMNEHPDRHTDQAAVSLTENSRKRRRRETKKEPSFVFKNSTGQVERVQVRLYNEYEILKFDNDD